MSGALRVVLACERLDVAGGVERFVCGLANDLVHRGLQVAVASVATQRSQVPYALDPAVQVLTGCEPAMPHRALSGYVGLLRRQWRVGRTLARAIREHHPDVIVLNGQVVACTVLLVDNSLAQRTIVCDHNHFDARSKIWAMLRRRLYPKVAALVSLTRADEPRFRALNPRVQVVYNASSLRADTPVAREHGVVLAVGRHLAQKGLDLLLEAWTMVCARVPDVMLRIVGEGPDTVRLQAQAQAAGIASRVQWAAATRDIESHYRAAMLFVLPSRYEGMPLALLEAQALGLPAVAFACPTGPDEIIDAGTGIVVPPQDVSALAAAILDLIHDLPKRRRMATAAIARSRAAFSMQTHLDQWTRLIRQVAQQEAAV